MGIMINQADIDIFEKHIELYQSLKKHDFIRNYTKEVYNELLCLYITYVSPTHTFSHWCSSCRSELVSQLYKWYEANHPTQWYAPEHETQVKEVPVVEQDSNKEIINLPPKKRRTKKTI
jgi:hypothetical protein